MKKDKDWLSEQVGDLNSTDAVFNESGLPYIDTVVSIERVFDLIYQLDEPEVLSQEWMKDNQLMKIGPEGVVYYVPVENLQSLLVPKQELPVIPKYVADWIEDLKSKEINLLESIYDFTHGEDIYDYIREQGNVLMRAWLDGFTVEKEQKYYVINNDQRMMLVRMMDGKTITEADPFKLEDMHEVEKKSHRLTEQEIKDYDTRYFAFAVPVDEVEE